MDRRKNDIFVWGFRVKVKRRPPRQEAHEARDRDALRDHRRGTPREVRWMKLRAPIEGNRKPPQRRRTYVREMFIVQKERLMAK